MDELVVVAVVAEPVVDVPVLEVPGDVVVVVAAFGVVVAAVVVAAPDEVVIGVDGVVPVVVPVVVVPVAVPVDELEPLALFLPMQLVSVPGLMEKAAD